MTKRRAEARSDSKRTQRYAAMLKEALARPGVQEVMDVYCNWQEKDHEIDEYRLATEVMEQFTTANYANTR